MGLRVKRGLAYSGVHGAGALDQGAFQRDRERGIVSHAGG